ncbi:unnamed protein product [Phaedon cochleariae]|uniref:DUF4806 domain-containing protein n=1 Tax=Phaedon cochleariae TaxID=80249 RepID=A0A9N9SCD0_PHACE|nr:unnamed protein product [Phaedon cochleariae]
MHLVYLGVMIKLIQFWVHGRMSARLKKHDLETISKHLNAIKPCITDTLDKARKKAEDMSYTDETDTEKGRGKRIKKKKQLSHMSDEDQSEDETEMEIGIDERQKRRQKSCDTSEEKNLSKRNLPLPKVPMPWESQLGKTHSQGTKLITELLSPEIMRQEDILDETTAESVNDEDPLNISSFGQDPSQRRENSFEYSETQDNLETEDNSGTEDNLGTAIENSNCDHSTILRRILFSITETKLLVGEIRKNLIETKRVKFLKSIGGKDSKEHIHRILKTFFEDTFAVNCSWLGQRENIRMTDLRVTKLLRNVVLEVHGENNKKV